MPRCTSTNLFASYDEPESEVESEDYSDGTITVSVRCVRPCAECSEEMAEYTFDMEQEVECPRCGAVCNTACSGEHELDADGNKLPDQAPILELESVDDPDVSESGGSRYKKNIFTCTVTANFLCTCCNESFSVELSDEAAASYFDVLV